MDDIFQGIESFVYKSQINIPYQWWAGETASKYFIALRDEKKILGTQCLQCNKVFSPPKKTCPYCFVHTSQWKELKPYGNVITFTVIYRQFSSLNKKVPVAVGLIQLDGADNGMLHYIDEIEYDKIYIGMKVEAVFSNESNATIHAISHFRPIK